MLYPLLRREAERSVGVKEARGTKRLKLTHAWQLRIMTDKGRLLTDITNHAR